MMCARAVKAEFQSRNFLLEYDHPEEFGRAQCCSRCCGSAGRYTYLVYRSIMFLFNLTLAIYTAATRGDIRYLIYLTHWSIWVLLTSQLLLWMCAFSHARNKRTDVTTERMRCMQKTAWIFYNVSTTAAFAVTLIFWGVLYAPPDPVQRAMMGHGFNSVIAMIDLLVIAVPVRLLHVWHVQIYATVYLIFTAIYWAAGGTAIYTILDWENNASLAVGVSVGAVFLVLPLLHVAVFVLYKLRLAVCKAACSLVPSDDKSGNENPAYHNEDLEIRNL